MNETVQQLAGGIEFYGQPAFSEIDLNGVNALGETASDRFRAHSKDRR